MEKFLSILMLKYIILIVRFLACVCKGDIQHKGRVAFVPGLKMITRMLKHQFDQT